MGVCGDMETLSLLLVGCLISAAHNVMWSADLDPRDRVRDADVAAELAYEVIEQAGAPGSGLDPLWGRSAWA